MPNPITAVLLSGTDYSDAATIADVYGGRDGTNGGGTFDVRGGSVYYSLQYATPGANPSGYGTPSWTADVLLKPYSGAIPGNASGIKFRNADAAAPATVSASIAPPNQPVLQLASANSVDATTTIAMLTGTVPAAGTNIPTSGSGFTYTHTNGTGVYVFTFDTAFAAPPTIELTMIQAAGTGFINLQAVPTSSGFTVLTFNSGAAAADRAFSFTAVPTV